MDMADGTRRTVVYLARHGQTALNESGVLRGLLDPPLNDAGRKQAWRLGVVPGLAEPFHRHCQSTAAGGPNGAASRRACRSSGGYGPVPGGPGLRAVGRRSPGVRGRPVGFG